ncbi:hypothetical protein O6H91_03G054000 [Diphasiastrum complanatum]|uniref:Uncharacterized protein n=1 Tax=Diphasiastrum complanatum TaxID=34168 RepID=A0ACC2E707_DIPCM|nr:hypothetical protein O6H91_03G054000 [Diphasiastrum complanatum]
MGSKHSCDSCLTEGLCSELWERLPDDLLEMVLARLPLSNLLCLRAVCKKWRDLVAFDHFRHLRAATLCGSRYWLAF